MNYITTRLVDGSISKFNAIVAPRNYISSNGDDFNLDGYNEVQPDSRHPRYRSSYTATGGGSICQFSNGLHERRF